MCVCVCVTKEGERCWLEGAQFTAEKLQRDVHFSTIAANQTKHSLEHTRTHARTHTRTHAHTHAQTMNTEEFVQSLLRDDMDLVILSDVHGSIISEGVCVCSVVILRMAHWFGSKKAAELFVFVFVCVPVLLMC